MISGRHVHHIDFAPSNEVRWDILSTTKNEELRDYILLVILFYARDNAERWQVFRYTSDENLREDALSAMIPHAKNIDELWNIYVCTTESTSELRDKILSAVETLRKTLPKIHGRDRMITLPKGMRKIQERNGMLSLPRPKKHEP